MRVPWEKTRREGWADFPFFSLSLSSVCRSLLTFHDSHLTHSVFRESPGSKLPGWQRDRVAISTNVC